MNIVVCQCKDTYIHILIHQNAVMVHGTSWNPISLLFSRESPTTQMHDATLSPHLIPSHSKNTSRHLSHALIATL